MPYSLEQQLRWLEPRTFEELCGQFIKLENPNAYHVEGSGGDEGLDVFEGSLDPSSADSGSRLRVWQVKFYRDGLK